MYSYVIVFYRNNYQTDGVTLNLKSLIFRSGNGSLFTAYVLNLLVVLTSKYSAFPCSNFKRQLNPWIILFTLLK